MNNKLINFFSHPILQLFSFCIILVGTNAFGGPFGYFVFFAGLQGYGYAVTGLAGIAITFISSLLRGKPSINWQLAGLICMIASFAWFVIGNTNRSEMRGSLPFLSLMLFVAVASAVVTNVVDVHRRE